MNKYLLISICILTSLFATAQDDSKYLAGAVPEVDGKVVFHKTIAVKNPVSDSDLYNAVEKWANDNYQKNGELNSRVLLSNPSSKDIACQGEEYLVFKRSMLVLDRAKMHYQLILEIGANKCEMTVRNLKYEYSDSKEIYKAEDLITDAIALNKSKNKLNRYYDKFRKLTIDSLNIVFNSLDVYLNGSPTVVAAPAIPAAIPPAVSAPAPTQTAAPTPAVQPQPAPAPTPVIAATPAVQTNTGGGTLPGFKQIAPDKIPGNYIKLLSDWTLITSGTTDQTNTMTASWGGLGTFWEKPVAFCFLNPTRYSVQTMDMGEYYTISFYTETYKEALKYSGSVSGRNTDKIKGSGLTPVKLPSGATAFSEAWMILECKKLVAQPLSPGAIADKAAGANWSKDGYHKMYIGEILNVWVK
ncbi:DUF4468 domain-containing protein [Dysgonomonas sp. 511]|uniref:DUF4468 domain-containing protein n=1 Tax=Dysgonomonas sp. 511 TaxID=2302930 RepID=UPI0013D3A2E9|nr:DUF4468 domain-containing protein [Dysgonomonas sp. 511]NDV79904.1 DUF4468 domain-containing protein [Dysgonomonas sp. 511]